MCRETHTETGGGGGGGGGAEREGGSVKECVRRDRDMGRQKEGRKA